MLELTGIHRSFAGPSGQVHALRDVSLRVASGELVVVEGQSGCGKTTLLLVAGAMLQPDAGQVRIDGQDPYAAGPGARSRLRAEKLGFVFQQFHLIPYLSVLDNILAPSVAFPNTQARERAMELIRHFKLEDRAHHVPAQLSSGERQRAALARALLNRPPVILADEPTGNLDRQNAETVFAHLSEIAHQGGAVLVVTHDRAAADYATRTLRMEAGRLQ